ncbi:hypothetical protein K439DRAFT_317100 [Ramaria rubella]|nr:hypothetical protein K439DRAFT_317100 [Ramaria rubella]
MSSTSVPPNIQEMMDGLYFNYTDFAALGMFILRVNQSKNNLQVVYLNIGLLSVLIVYDTILTFPYEIEFLWKRKWRLAAVLYFLTRYAWILEQIVQLVFDFRSNTSIKSMHEYDSHA